MAKKRTPVAKAVPAPVQYSGGGVDSVPEVDRTMLTTELGNTGLYRPWGYTREEFLPQLRGQRAANIYREMSDNDPIVGAVLFAIEMLLRRVEWNVEADDEDPMGVEAADFLTTAMGDMSHSWADFIADILTMLPFGYSYLEIVYKYRNGPMAKTGDQRSAYTDGKLGWRKFMLIPQDTISHFVYDNHGGIQAAVQQAGGAMVCIPIEKSALFRTQNRLPTGRSVLRNAYQPWYYKKRIEETEGIGIDRDLAGLPVMYLDPAIIADVARKAEYEQIVRNIRRDEQEGVLLPVQYDANGNQLVKLELLTSGGARQFDTNTIIQRHARSIAMTTLQDVIMLGHEKVGTQALAGEKRDLSDTALSAWLDSIGEVINTHLVPRLLELNGYSLEDPPVIVAGDLREEDVLGFTEAVRNIAQAGFAIAGDPEVENFVRRRLGLPPIDEAMAQEPDPELQTQLDEALAQIAALEGVASMPPPMPPVKEPAAANGNGAAKQ